MELTDLIFENASVLIELKRKLIYLLITIGGNLEKRTVRTVKVELTKRNIDG